MLVDKGCFDRGCACYDDRIDKDGVEIMAKEDWDTAYQMGLEAGKEIMRYQLQVELEFCARMAEMEHMSKKDVARVIRERMENDLPQLQQQNVLQPDEALQRPR